MKTEWTPLHEALARAYVHGWSAGRNGVRHDSGKIATAEMLADEFPQILEQVKMVQDELRLSKIP